MPHELVGRDRLLTSIDKLVARVVAGQRVAALITGEAGIGKTSLLREAATRAAAAGARTAWGTCLDLDAAPGFWPWTQALEGLLRTIGDATVGALGEDTGWVATIVPSAGDAPPGDGSQRDRLLAMDATRRLLEAIAAQRPVLVVLDDLQWADASSLGLIDLVIRSPTQVGLGVIGAYRDDELSSSTRQKLSTLASSTEHLHVEGLDVDAVRALVERTTGSPVSVDTAAAAHRRTGGHPFFVRELALLGNFDIEDERVPAAVRDAIHRRLETLPGPTIAVLEAAALAGLTVLPDVVSAALGDSDVDVDAAIRSALGAGILVTTDSKARFAHDLLRETLQDRVEGDRRVALHRAIGSALERRVERGDVVPPSEVARHFVAALPLDGADRAVRWALNSSSKARQPPTGGSEAPPGRSRARTT